MKTTKKLLALTSFVILLPMITKMRPSKAETTIEGLVVEPSALL